MKFKFPLQKVLNHRKLQENLAQAQFQEAMSKLNTERQKLEDMLNEKSSAHKFAFESQSKGGRAGSTLSQVFDFLKGQDIRIEKQKQKIQYCETIVEEMREILRQKAIEYKIIEGLRDRKLQQHKEAEQAREVKRADDMNSMRFGRFGKDS